MEVTEALEICLGNKGAWGARRESAKQTLENFVLTQLSHNSDYITAIKNTLVINRKCFRNRACLELVTEELCRLHSAKAPNVT